ncbi:hypothetical protein OEZ85_004281 [Tetradesmus obliquus]|uniref:Uncharacterized protein n=1 Tax=Tetradesmus obliquus TaxID=3088 RepID=A0ABY8UKL2_TETOB|nr:hypothetical protein OEZ85_004281 [Tetradesmus obliquus]
MPGSSIWNLLTVQADVQDNWAPNNVWLQLLVRCTSSELCGDEAARKVVAAFEAQQTETKAAEDRADALKQQLDASQAQLAAAAARADALEQQLTAERAAAAAAAALREQLAAATAQQSG